MQQHNWIIFLSTSRLKLEIKLRVSDIFHKLIQKVGLILSEFVF
jgi:hypothetical protein